ncbi:MAG TPA: ribonuclease P protein component [Candidatus Saccharimonadales bacterium]|nr:ribonuclease P protein component [Candidatus Saccharimonadales bacterium]
MLASQYRLKKSREITRVLQRGVFKSVGVMTIKFHKNGQDFSRVAIVVSKKVSKKAVVRNKIRRRISGVLEDKWGTVAGGYDIVMVVREDISELAAPQLASRVVSLFERSQIVKGK